jgi:hypothetical protein
MNVVEVLLYVLFKIVSSFIIFCLILPLWGWLVNVTQKSMCSHCCSKSLIKPVEASVSNVLKLFFTSLEVWLYKRVSNTKLKWATRSKQSLISCYDFEIYVSINSYLRFVFIQMNGAVGNQCWYLSLIDLQNQQMMICHTPMWHT